MDAVRQRKPRTLWSLLLGYLFLTAGLCFFTVLVWWLGVMQLFHAGILLPAYTMEQQTGQAVEALTGAEHFAPEQLPPQVRWMLLDRAAPQAKVLDTNMTDPYRNAAYASVEEVLLWASSPQKTVQARPAGGYGQYYRVVWLGDGTVCLFQFDYRVQYADAERQKSWPDFQYTCLVLLFLMLTAAVTLTTRRTGRMLKRETDRLAAVCARIAAHDLQGADFDGAEIREFDTALTAMQTLRESLSGSLQAQWRMEQQRADRMTRLAHELKNPLAIIQGNAELLAEEPLTDSQREKVEAILRGSSRALTATAHLRKMGLPDVKNKP